MGSLPEKDGFEDKGLEWHDGVIWPMLTDGHALVYARWKGGTSLWLLNLRSREIWPWAPNETAHPAHGIKAKSAVVSGPTRGEHG
jgi:hypothetical protein